MSTEQGLDQKGAHMVQDNELKDRDEVTKHRDQMWLKMIGSPEWLVSVDTAYVAGGMALEYALREGEIRDALERVSRDNNGELTIAGVKFTLKELELLRRFNLFDTRMKQCIDERLQGGDENSRKNIHSSCGLIGALQSVTGIENLEDKLALMHGLQPEQKHPLLEGTEDEHVSSTILVSFSSQQHIVDPNRRDEVIAQHALPFNVSLPIDKIADFSSDAAERKELVDVMVRWSAVIASNIIAGPHNLYANVADKTLIVVDRRGISNLDLLKYAEDLLLNSVQHSSVMYLN